MRAAIVETARSYLGVPFRHQGRNRAGLDCAGLVVRVGHDLGLTTFDRSDYGRSPRGDMMLQVMQEQCVARTGEPAPGMIALMRFAAEPQHVGVIGEQYGALTIIHALSTSRQVVEHRLDRMWRARIVGLFDLPGVS